MTGLNPLELQPLDRADRNPTEPSHAERLCALSEAVFRILGDPDAFVEAPGRILEAIRRELGVEMAGIRLRQGATFPLAAAAGVSVPDQALSNRLAPLKIERGVVGRETGGAWVACVQRLVSLEGADPRGVQWTAGGSAWANGLAAGQDGSFEGRGDGAVEPSPAAADAGRDVRSVALVPVRVGQDVLGVLQLSDRRPGFFTSALVRHLEGLAASLGVVLKWEEQEARLRESELRLQEERRLAQMGSRRLDQATNQLACSELKHRIVADHTYDWEFWIDPQGRFAYTSPSCERITGYRPVDFEADPGLLLRILHPEDRGRYQAHCSATLAAQGEPEQEFRLVRADGEMRWIGHVCVPVRDEAGEFLGVRGSNRDITERKRSEHELAQSRRQQDRLLLFNQALLNAIPAPIFYKDRDGRYLGCNRRFTELIGVTTEEVRGKTVYEVWPGDQAQEYHSRDLELLANPKEQSYEFRVRAKDGVERAVIFVKNVFYDEDNQPAGIIGAFLDISERKRAEESLAAEVTLRRILIEGSRDGIVVVDQEGKVFEANRRFGEMLGYTAEEVKHLHVWDWDREWPREKVLEAMRRMGPEGARLETRHWRKDGSYYDVELSNSAAEMGGQRLVFCVCHDVTERKRAMEALAAREEIFSSIVGQAADAIALIEGSTGRFIEFNASAHEGLGYTREEFSRFAVRDIQAEHSEEVIAGNLAAVRQHGGATFETKHRHRDASIRDVRVSVRSLNLRGRDCMAAVWTDITDRKRAEARVRRDNLRTEFLLELHQRAPQMNDGELYKHVLDRAVRLTDSELGFFHVVSEDQSTVLRTSWIRAGSAVMDGGGPYAVEEAGDWLECIRAQRPVVRNAGLESSPAGLPEGDAWKGRFMTMPVLQEGRVRIVFGVAGRADAYTEEDVAQLQVVANELYKMTVQRAAENQLRQLSQVVQQSPVSVIITNPQGRIEYINPRFTQVTGYTLEEVLGRTPQVLKSGEMDAAHYQRLWQTLLSGHAWHGEFHNRKKNGELHWESASISPITDPAGRITHFVAVKADITEQKRLEQQLRQAQKLEAVGQLAGGIAHDFNNILAAIMMHLGLIQTQPALDPETRESVKELEMEATRAASLTRQLLMFSRRSVLAIQPQDLNEVVANLLKMLNRLIGENVRLCFEGASSLPPVEADAGMLEQVLLNLVVNARDAMPKGGRITIATSLVEFRSEGRGAHPERRSGRFVNLSVSDTGTGMDDATLKRIFEPFFTTKEAGRGTGLGLATVHGIVAQHKGWVEVESRPGLGSTFRVFLPAMTRVGGGVERISEATPLPRGRETILVVEDEGQLRNLVGRTLRGLGYRVFEAENGQEAMRTWQECGTQVDLLLTDMVMPEGMTGLELADRLLSSRPGLKVIISSGYSAEIVHAGLPTKAGITYLPKPYPDKVLAEVVRQCLDRKH